MPNIYDDEMFSTNHFIYKYCGFDLFFKKKFEEVEKAATKAEEKGIFRVFFDWMFDNYSATGTPKQELYTCLNKWGRYMDKNTKPEVEPKEDNYILHIPARIKEMSKTIFLGEMSIVMDSDKVNYVSDSINEFSYSYVKSILKSKKYEYKQKLKFSTKEMNKNKYRKALKEVEHKLSLLFKYKNIFKHFHINVEHKDWLLVDIYTTKGNFLQTVSYNIEGELFSDYKVINYFLDVIKDTIRSRNVEIERIEVLSANIEYRFDGCGTMPKKIPKFYHYKDVEKLFTIKMNTQIWP